MATSISNREAYRIFLGRVNIRTAPHPHHFPRFIEEKKETHAHSTVFEALTRSLKEHQLDYTLPPGEEAAQDCLQRAIRRLGDRDIHIFLSGTGRTFALEHDGRWLAILVPPMHDPASVANEVEIFLNEQTRQQRDISGLSINVDLVPRPGLITKELGELHQIVTLSLRLRLPNARWRKKGGLRDLRPVIQKMIDYRAPTADVSFHGEDIAPPEQDVEILDEEASSGDIDVLARSADGHVFDSAEHPAEYETEYARIPDLAPLGLILAIFWLIEEWVSRGWGGAA